MNFYCVAALRQRLKRRSSYYNNWSGCLWNITLIMCNFLHYVTATLSLSYYLYLHLTLLYDILYFSNSSSQIILLPSLGTLSLSNLFLVSHQPSSSSTSLTILFSEQASHCNECPSAKNLWEPLFYVCDVKKDVSVLLSNLNDYRYDEINMRAGYNYGSRSPVPGIDEAHWRKLTKSSRNISMTIFVP